MIGAFTALMLIERTRQIDQLLDLRKYEKNVSRGR